MEDGSIFDEKDLIFPSSLPKDLIYGPVLPMSAIAGLVGKEAETFRVITCHLFLFTFPYPAWDLQDREDHPGF